MDLKRVVAELQRRHVWRVAGVYAVAGWVIIQVVATVFPLLGLSEKSAKLVVILIAAGFPIALVLAWVFDLTPAGLRRTEALPETAVIRPPEAHHRSRAVGFFGVGILVALVAFAALSRVRGDHAERSRAGIRSIAVLPFEDMSQKHDQGYFTDGITEELLNRLAQMKDLKVPARTSSFAFRGSALDISEIAKRLEVQAVLEGSVRRDGNNVRVTARLIDARTQAKLWTNTYEREVSSIFAIQDEIATDIVKELSLQIDPQSLPGTRTLNNVAATPAAVDAYMKGLELLNRRSDGALRNAVTQFQRAVQQDSTFALGYAMLAQTYALLPSYGEFPPFEASSKGQAAAAHALELNPNLPEAYAALGQIRQNFEWDFESAERSYRRAILFNNGYANAHLLRGEALLFLGRFDESLREMNTALDLDPASGAALLLKAYQHVIRREFPAANRILDQIIASSPEYSLALLNKAALALMTGQATAAIRVFPALARRDQDALAAFNAVAAAATDPSRRGAADAALARLEGRRSGSELALWYALAGSKSNALARIKSSYESGADANLPYILLHPAFNSIRADREYQEILRELHMSGQ